MTSNKDLEKRIDKTEMLAILGFAFAVAIIVTFFVWVWLNPYHPQYTEASPCELGLMEWEYKGVGFAKSEVLTTSSGVCQLELMMEEEQHQKICELREDVNQTTYKPQCIYDCIKVTKEKSCPSDITLLVVDDG